MSPVRILIFAKAPLAGLAKTRLIPSLGAQGAAELARRMLAHTLEQALSAGVGPVELCVTPSPADPIWQAFSAPAPVTWSDQGEGDLGARMARAARCSDKRGEAVLLIGTDCPALDAAQLRVAAQSLETYDATLIPSADGGYVLLGLKRFHASLFEDIAWSTDAVARETLLRLQQLGWRVNIYPSVHDIDEPADLQWLPRGWRKSRQEIA
jgi:rSAM/selenodomain-associated transferase 1